MKTRKTKRSFVADKRTWAAFDRWAKKQGHTFASSGRVNSSEAFRQMLMLATKNQKG